MNRDRSFVIRGARVFDGVAVISADSVWVHNGLIAQVGSQLAIPPSVPVIAGAGMMILPGFIDGHTHTPSDLRYAERALRQALAFGVTTVICQSTDPATARAMKNLASRQSDLADLRSAGRLVTVAGGHPTQMVPDEPYPVLSGPGDAVAYIEDHIAANMDQVKIVIEDGTTVGRPMPCVPPELSDAVTAEAHRRGLMVVAHVATERDALQALASGVDGLVHQYLDKPQSEVIAERLSDNDTFVCMTLATYHNAEGARLAADTRVTPFVEHHWLEHLAHGFPSGWPNETYRRHALEAVGILRQSGVCIVAGTDSPVPGTGHGVSLHHELELLVRGGLTPTEAITAATSSVADRYRLADRGRIAPGLRADLLLVEEDPTTDIDATLNIRQIWRGGESFDRDRHRLAVVERTP